MSVPAPPMLPPTLVLRGDLVVRIGIYNKYMDAGELDIQPRRYVQYMQAHTHGAVNTRGGGKNMDAGERHCQSGKLLGR